MALIKTLTCKCYQFITLVISLIYVRPKKTVIFNHWVFSLMLDVVPVRLIAAIFNMSVSVKSIV